MDDELKAEPVSSAINTPTGEAPRTAEPPPATGGQTTKPANPATKQILSADIPKRASAAGPDGDDRNDDAAFRDIQFDDLFQSVAQKYGDEAPEAATAKVDDGGEHIPTIFAATQGRPWPLAFLVALGALSGEPASQVQTAATKLQARILARAPAAATSDAPFLVDLGLPRSQLLRQFEARAVTNNKTLVEILELDQPGHGPGIVAYAHTELGAELGQDVIAWMRDLAASEDASARAAMGATCGALAREDFTGMRAQLLEPWLRAPTTAPLVAFDAALASLCDGKVPHPVAAFIDEMLGRLDLDDVFALAFLAGGRFGRRSPETAFRILARLLQLGRPEAFSLALGGYAAWLVRGQADTRFAGRALVELEKAAASGDGKAARNKAWIAMALLLKAASTDDDAPEIFTANLASLEAVAAFGRLLNHACFFPENRPGGQAVRREAREVTRNLFRAGLQDQRIRSLAWPVFRSAVEQGGSHASRLRDLMMAWRQRLGQRSATSNSVEMP